MAQSAAKKVSNLFVWILMGLLFVALAGFGIGSFAGGSSQVGQVGTAEITAEDYFRALDNEIRAQIAETGQPVNLADLRARRIDEQVIAGLVARAALNHEAAAMGISVGDEEVARQIRAIAAFQDTSGNFDLATYEFLLEQQGASPREFEEDTREDISRALLQSAVIGGLSAPEPIVEAITAFQGETRDFSYVAIGEDALNTPVPTPSEADLQAYYDANPERFRRPEARAITYAWLTPDMLLDNVDLPEEDLRALYEDRIDLYVQPERRILERLAFGSEEAARAALDAISAGETDFEALVAERDLTLDDVDLGIVSAFDLEPDAAEVIFADTVTEILGPLPSSIGPALYRVNAVLEASETTFDEARADLAAELAEDAARREIDALREELDDLLASGATLEEMGSDTAMELGQIDFDVTSEDGIAAYDNFRDAAFAAEARDFPELLDLSDGGVFALRLDEIVAPRVPPLAEIEDEVTAAWRATTLREAVSQEASELIGQLAQGARLEDLGEVTTERLIRRQDLPPELPPTAVAQVFQLDAVGDVAMIPGAEAAYILSLDAITPANRQAPDTEIILLILEQTLTQAIATDIFEAYGQATQAEAGVSLNQSVINSVHAAFP